MSVNTSIPLDSALKFENGYVSHWSVTELMSSSWNSRFASNLSFTG